MLFHFLRLHAREFQFVFAFFFDLINTVRREKEQMSANVRQQNSHEKVSDSFMITTGTVNQL